MLASVAPMLPCVSKTERDPTMWLIAADLRQDQEKSEPRIAQSPFPLEIRRPRGVRGNKPVDGHLKQTPVNAQLRHPILLPVRPVAQAQRPDLRIRQNPPKVWKRHAILLPAVIMAGCSIGYTVDGEPLIGFQLDRNASVLRTVAHVATSLLGVQPDVLALALSGVGLHVIRRRSRTRAEARQPQPRRGRKANP